MGETNGKTAEKPWILIVDDEVGYRNMIEWYLNDQGFNVETASDGAQALELAQQRNFSLVITDITMPQLNGLELLVELKKAMPKTTVIIATGFGTVETAVFAMKKGACDFILKPFDLQDFLSKVEEALKGGGA